MLAVILSVMQHQYMYKVFRISLFLCFTIYSNKVEKMNVKIIQIYRIKLTKFRFSLHNLS